MNISFYNFINKAPTLKNVFCIKGITRCLLSVSKPFSNFMTEPLGKSSEKFGKNSLYGKPKVSNEL
jgi:hypothetical protein